MPAFMWILRIQTQVDTLAQKVLSLTETSHGPLIYFGVDRRHRDRRPGISGFVDRQHRDRRPGITGFVERRHRGRRPGISGFPSRLALHTCVYV